MARKHRPPQVLTDVLVEDFAAEGKSLARVNGKVIFIEKTVPGDVVDIQIWKNKKDWAEAWVKTYKQQSALRVQPFCNHFGTCGGCQWQMLPYEVQMQYKQQQVEDQMKRIAKIPLPTIQPILPAKLVSHYRNKVEYAFAVKQYFTEAQFQLMQQQGLPVQELMMGKFAGFHAKGSFDKVVPIDTCHLQQEPTNALRNKLIQFAIDNAIPVYDLKTHFGWLRDMRIRLATTGELMVNICLGYEHEDMENALKQFMLQHFPEITTLLFTINTKWNDSIYDLTPKVIKGNGYIIEKLGDYAFKVGPKSFFQTNSYQALQLYQTTLQYAELNGQQVVYDLYCGTGSIGIFVSQYAKKIIGVELIQEAIDDAKENAALNNVQHAHFFSGDAEKVCNETFFEEYGRPDVIITDPPRAGMSAKLVATLLQVQAPLIVYVSCNPATQARDLALLAEKYEVTKMQPVDMFPQTHHIENVAQLKLKTAVI